jgi:hypothetical protein
MVGQDRLDLGKFFAQLPSEGPTVGAAADAAGRDQDPRFASWSRASIGSPPIDAGLPPPAERPNQGGDRLEKAGRGGQQGRGDHHGSSTANACRAARREREGVQAD